MQVAASANFKATGSAEATATSIPRQTTPLTPATPCSVSTTPANTSGASDIKEFFESSYEKGCDNGNDDDDNADDNGDDETNDGDGGDADDGDHSREYSGRRPGVSCWMVVMMIEAWWRPARSI